MKDFWIQESKKWMDEAGQTVCQWIDDLPPTQIDNPQQLKEKTAEFVEQLEAWGKQVRNSVEKMLPDQARAAKELTQLQDLFRNEWSQLAAWFGHSGRYFDAGKTLLTMVVRTHLVERTSFWSSEEEKQKPLSRKSSRKCRTIGCSVFETTRGLDQSGSIFELSRRLVTSNLC